MHVVNAAVLEDWNELSDEQVVADVLAGHTALFELLMRRHNEACTARRARSFGTKPRWKTLCSSHM